MAKTREDRQEKEEEMREVVMREAADLEAGIEIEGIIAAAVRVEVTEEIAGAVESMGVGDDRKRQC